MSWLLVAVVACSSSNADPAERALAEYGALRDRMCACADKACKHDVDDAVAAWDKTESGRIVAKTPKNEITEEQTKRIDPIERELKRCRH